MAEQRGTLESFKDYLKTVHDVDAFYMPTTPYTLRDKSRRSWTEAEFERDCPTDSAAKRWHYYQEMARRDVPTLSKGDEEC